MPRSLRRAAAARPLAAAAAAAIAAVAAPGCGGGDPEPTTSRVSPVVYGADDRLDYYRVAEPALRDLMSQVAQRLSVTTATVYGLCAAGRLSHVRILNVIRIAPRDLAAFITSCRVGNRGGNAR